LSRPLDLIALARGDETVWSVTGADVYDLADAATVIENAVTSQPLAIPSETYTAEIMTRCALAQLPGSDEGTKQKIKDEIRKNVRPEMFMPAAMSIDGERAGEAGPGQPANQSE
jgi:hypothetical protein